MRTRLRRSKSLPTLQTVQNAAPMGGVAHDNGLAQEELPEAQPDDQGVLAEAESEVSSDEYSYDTSDSSDFSYELPSGPRVPRAAYATLAEATAGFRPAPPEGSLAQTDTTRCRATERRQVDVEWLTLVMELAERAAPELKIALRSREFGASVLDQMEWGEAVTFDRLSEAVAAAALAEGGPECQLPGAAALVDMQTDPRERLALAARLMMGELEWRAEGEGDFVQAVQDGDLSQLPADARMNCWEATLLAAYRAGQVDIGTLQHVYAEDAEPSRLRRFLGVDRSYLLREGGQVWVGHHDAPPVGSLLFIGQQSEALHHVVLVVSGATLEDTQCMSLHSSGTGGVFGRMSLASYADADAIRVCEDPFVL